MTSSASDRPLRVLIVEDERRLCEMLRTAVPDMGFAATGTCSGEEALGAMEASPHEIVMLDIRLPGMTGLELCETIHQRWPLTATVILTGFGDLEAARRAIRCGVVEFLTKPASLGEIEQALDRARSSHLIRKRCLAPQPAPAAASLSAPKPPAGPAKTLDELEREHILAALDHHKGNRTAAAAELGISLRTLYYRLAQYERQSGS